MERRAGEEPGRDIAGIAAAGIVADIDEHGRRAGALELAKQVGDRRIPPLSHRAPERSAYKLAILIPDVAAVPDLKAKCAVVVLEFRDSHDSQADLGRSGGEDAGAKGEPGPVGNQIEARQGVEWQGQGRGANRSVIESCAPAGGILTRIYGSGRL